MARSVKIGPLPCMTTCPLHSTSLHMGTIKVLFRHFGLCSQKLLAASKITVKVFSSPLSVSSMAMIEYCCMCCEEATNGFPVFNWSMALICDLYNLYACCSQSFVGELCTSLCFMMLLRAGTRLVLHR